MPEMPEVEQVRKTLAPHIIGKKILSVEVRLPRLIQQMTAEEFEKALTGCRIDQVQRRGKYLLLQTERGTLVVHLRMTGALIATEGGAEPPYAKVRFQLTGDTVLWFTDIRTFGTLYFVQDVNSISGLAALGPEPLTQWLTAEYLQAKAARAKKPVKSFILDQTVIAGLGNIYADEALFLAGLAPLRQACELTADEVVRLIAAVNKVIAQGIKNHGTTFRDYKDGEGKKGSNQNFLNVYSRGGQPCKVCGQILNKTKVGGRGTVWCSHCQK